MIIFADVCADEPTFTVDAKTLNFDGDEQVLKAEDVVIAFKNGAKLISRHAELDFDSIHGVMSSGEEGELVIFSGFVSDERGGQLPIIVKGKIMVVGISEDEDHREVVEVTAEGDVEILYDEDYTAYGDRVHFQNERQSDLSSLTKSGSLILKGNGSDIPCCIQHKNGDVIEAAQIVFLPSENQVDAWNVKGSITSLGYLREVEIASDHVCWLPRKGRVVFSGKTIISDGEVGTLSNLGTIEVDREDETERARIKEVVAKGETRLENWEAEQSLGCFGVAQLQMENRRLVLSSPKDGLSDIPITQQAYYQDLLGQIHADRFEIDFNLDQGKIHPTHIVMRGSVRMQNQLIPDPQVQVILEQYAIADLVKYSPDTKQMTCVAKKGKRVLYFDKTKGLQVSAPGLHVTRGTKGEWEVQGKGNVRMKFTHQEVSQLQEIFPFLK